MAAVITVPRELLESLAEVSSLTSKNGPLYASHLVREHLAKVTGGYSKSRASGANSGTKCGASTPSIHCLAGLRLIKIRSLIEPRTRR